MGVDCGELSGVRQEWFAQKSNHAVASYFLTGTKRIE